MKSYGKVIWLTGMSGAGKSTIARKASLDLKGLGFSVIKIDGDDVRKIHNGLLGYTREDVIQNNEIIIKLADQARKKADLVLITVIGPLRLSRGLARALFSPHFAEVYVAASINSLRRRDTKGLYSKFDFGEIDDLIGVGNGVPYEFPLSPELVIETEEISVAGAVEQFVNFVACFAQNDQV